MPKPIVNQSRVQAWRTCRQLYAYKYDDEIVPKRTPRPFMFGTLVHQMLQAGIDADDDNAGFKLLENIDLQQGKMFREEREHYGEILSDITIIMDEYYDYWPKRDFTYLKLPHGRKSEYTFQLELKRFIAEGTIDALIETPNLRVWLGEHKTHSDKPSEDHRWRNLQGAVYLTAIQQLKIVPKVHGVVWNYISSKPPTVPEYLEKSHRLSKREIVTLPAMVYSALKTHGLSAADHREQIEAAKSCRSRYFDRIYTPINPHVQKLLWQGFVDTAHEIIDNRGKRDKNIGRHCEWCSYEPLCRTELTGGDLAFTKKTLFQADTPRGEQPSGKGDRRTPTPRSGKRRPPKLRVVR